METRNIRLLAVFLVLSLCSHLAHNAGATCSPRSSRYLLSASGSPAPASPQQPKHFASSTNESTAAPAPQPTLASAPSPSNTPSQPKEPVTNIHKVVTEVSELPVPNSELTKVCEATENPLLCLSTVAPYVQGKFDPVSILAGEIKAIQNHTKVVMEQAGQIASDPSTPEDIVEALEYCKENYESVAVNLDDAMKGLDDHDAGLLNSMLSAVATDVTTCQDTFGEVTTSANPMAAMDEITMNMAYNCLAILDYLKW